LKQWKNTLIVVSHDRDFLDEVATDIVLMKDKTLTRYKGNYSRFVCFLGFMFVCFLGFMFVCFHFISTFQNIVMRNKEQHNYKFWKRKQTHKKKKKKDCKNILIKIEQGK